MKKTARNLCCLTLAAFLFACAKTNVTSPQKGGDPSSPEANRSELSQPPKVNREAWLNALAYYKPFIEEGRKILTGLKQAQAVHKVETKKSKHRSFKLLFRGADRAATRKRVPISFSFFERLKQNRSVFPHFASLPLPSVWEARLFDGTLILSAAAFVLFATGLGGAAQAAPNPQPLSSPSPSSYGRAAFRRHRHFAQKNYSRQ